VKTTEPIPKVVISLQNVLRSGNNHVKYHRYKKNPQQFRKLQPLDKTENSSVFNKYCEFPVMCYIAQSSCISYLVAIANLLNLIPLSLRRRSVVISL